MTAWVVRAGRHGHDEDFNLTTGRTASGWGEYGDLTPYATREQLRAVVDARFPDDPLMRRAIRAGQLAALRLSIAPGDIIVMPMKSKPGHVAIGVCTAPYEYDPRGDRPGRRHRIPVGWNEDLLSRSVFKDDLLSTINGAQSVFSASRTTPPSGWMPSPGDDPIRARRPQGARRSGCGTPRRCWSVCSPRTTCCRPQRRRSSLSRVPGCSMSERSDP